MNAVVIGLALACGLLVLSNAILWFRCSNLADMIFLIDAKASEAKRNINSVWKETANIWKCYTEMSDRICIIDFRVKKIERELKKNNKLDRRKYE